MSAIRNEMILASAGSGKTYALTTRFIALLATGVAPERIAALTFTRKAAGEFFDEILTRLADAASSGAAAGELSRAVDRPGLGPAEFGKLLRTVADAMPRLMLGTLDGFFAGVVRAFPLELGLAGEMQILDTPAAAEEVRRVMGRMFAVTRSRNAGQDAILDAFKLATLGVEEKAVTRLLDRFLEDYHELYRAAGDPDAWGNGQRIWPGGFPWGDGGGEPEGRVRVLLDWVANEGASMAAGQPARWEGFARACLEWSPGSPLPRKLSYIVENVLEAGTEFAEGRGSVTIERKPQNPPAPVCEAVLGLVHRVVALELGRRITATKGIASLLREFDAAYDAEVRRSGRLTFSDVLELLGASRVLEGDGDDDAGRRAVEFRLDGRIDHWLLDEFQDTNRRQWQVLEGLIDEAVQDPSGSRSFFYVGDVKQAIFSWRGGDPRLFRHVFGRYSAGGRGAIHERELNRSFRSGEAIITFVNRVFGAADAVSNVFAEAAANWKQVWRSHESAVPERKGQAALLVADGEDGRFRTTLELIRSLDPVARGFSCAVLVQKNNTATRMAEFLRRAGGIAAVAESDLMIGKDNPWSATFVSLLRAAAHPGDSVSWHHLQTTPARVWLGDLGVTTPDQLSRRILAQVGERGYESLASAWLEGMEKFLKDDDSFTRRRAGQLIVAAREFDEGGGGSVAAFIRFLESSSVRESEGADVVRVMTIHKSKGLGFDIVILPDLEGTGLAQRRDGPAVSKGGDGAVEWILEYPGGWIAENDPRLREYLGQAKGEACFENLALLYVAMTRAKRGLYAIITPPGKSKARSYPRFLADAVGGKVGEIAVGSGSFQAVFATGDSTWLADGGHAEPPPAWRPETVSTALAVNRPVRRVASAVGGKSERLAEILSAERGLGAKHGIALHELLAEIEWSDGLDISRWSSGAMQRGVAGGVAGEAAALLGAPESREVFARPGKGWVALRECPIEALVDGVWVSGVIDRMVVARDAEGRIREARIYDFKSDRIWDETEQNRLVKRYSAQMETYRRLMATATGLTNQSVRAGLVFTKVARLIWIP